MSNKPKMKKCETYDLPLDITSNTAKDYMPALQMLLNDGDFQQLIDHRSRMYNARGRAGANQYMICKGIVNDDRKIGSFLLRLFQNNNMENGISKTIPFNQLWDSIPKDDEKKQKLKVLCSRSLDMVIFLADVMESKIKDIREYLATIFDKEYDYAQFEGVVAAINQLESLFGRTRDKGSMEEKLLFAEYAQSLEDFFDKRMKTFITKDTKLQKQGKSVVKSKTVKKSKSKKEASKSKKETIKRKKTEK